MHPRWERLIGHARRCAERVGIKDVDEWKVLVGGIGFRTPKGILKDGKRGVRGGRGGEMIVIPVDLQMSQPRKEDNGQHVVMQICSEQIWHQAAHL